MLRRLLAILGATLLLLLLGWLVLRVREQRGIPDYYEQADGTRVGVLISRTEIGIVPRPGIDAGQAVASVTALGLTRAQIPNSTLLILSLPEPRDRAGLLELTRTIAAQRNALLAYVGMVVRMAPDGAPGLAATDLIVKLRPGRTAAELRGFNTTLGAVTVMEDPFVPGDFLLRLLPASNLDALAAARRYLASGLVDFAFPNFINSATNLQPAPTDPPTEDPLLSKQWPLENTGQTNAIGEPGAMDADADIVEAWRITKGAPATIIAVIENEGFEIDHPDLEANLWTNLAELNGSAGVDDDHNRFVDDVHGWDFSACPEPPSLRDEAGEPEDQAREQDPDEGADQELMCGDSIVEPNDDPHGTAVAGIAAARGDNGEGISGVCPQCRWMPLRTAGGAGTDWAKSLAAEYAVSQGAQIVNISWEMTFAPRTMARIQALASMGRGAVFTVAAGNSGDRCNQMLLHTLASVIAVSSSTNQDRKVKNADSGVCVDILAPSDRGDSHYPRGTLSITTTDLLGATGYNSFRSQPCPSDESTDEGYTHCFLGTSAAAPFVAGVAGLVLTARPSLAREQVQRLLQDTADKIEPGEANYSPVNGFSQGRGTPTHAYGRVNAYEAVRIVAAGQKNGVDVFVRDSGLDWGNTEYEPARGAVPDGDSPDVKIDSAPLLATAPATSGAFDSFRDESPKAGATNRVYVRVRNRGPDPSGAVTVKLLWAPASNPLPALPEGFWAAFPGDAPAASAWTPAGVQTVASVPYSGSSLAGGGQDAAQIVSFDVALPTGLTGNVSFLVILDAPPQDPASQNGLVPETLASGDNNVTFRNARLQ